MPLPLTSHEVESSCSTLVDLGVPGGTVLDGGSHPKIIGLKQSVGSLDHDTLEILRRGPAFQVLVGDDAFIALTVLMGGAGAIAAAAHFCTPLFVEMIEAAARGDAQRSRLLASALLPVVQAGFAEPNPAVWKAGLHAVGEIVSPSVRRPMTPASHVSAAALVNAASVAEARRGAEANLRQ